KVVLRQGAGRQLLDPKQEKEEARRSLGSLQPVPRTSFGGYSAEDPHELADHLDRDVRKIFKWQNVWRVAGTLGNNPPAAPGLKREVMKLQDEKYAGALRETFLQPGQRIEVRLRNEGAEDLWVTVLFLDADFGIRELLSDSLESKKLLATR